MMPPSLILPITPTALNRSRITGVGPRTPFIRVVEGVTRYEGVGARFGAGGDESVWSRNLEAARVEERERGRERHRERYADDPLQVSAEGQQEITVQLDPYTDDSPISNQGFIQDRQSHSHSNALLDAASYDHPPPSLILVDLSPSYADRLDLPNPASSSSSDLPKYDVTWERLPKYTRAIAANDGRGGNNNETQYLLAGDPELGMLTWPIWMPGSSQAHHHHNNNIDDQGRPIPTTSQISDTAVMTLNILLVLACLAIWTLVIVSLRWEGVEFPLPVGEGGRGIGGMPLGSTTGPGSRFEAAS